MSDIDLSEFLTSRRKKSICIVGEVLATLTDEDQEKFEAACKHPDVSASSLQRWLAARGQTVTNSTMQRHRRHECPCNG